ncbi:2'-5' RNA ligase superfamily protein [Dyadobacter soli]|uniref:2'-5' RNA ligase superfamily protein n=1 Tax=Dyadobacter soli TaxID=659014 RepID=A0A1G7JIJ3_9BACT|nr:2'-5' RNA ligase family protein [Dyadobacter soli]SDF24723.1 2'-5' RNA ligase superfamily protein [Dyadobacter soli]
MLENNHFSRIITVFHGREAPERALLVGYGAIIDKLDLKLPLPDKLSLIGARYKQFSDANWTVFTASYAPTDSLYGHLVFGLKYEGINLLFFKKLFERIGKSEAETLVSIERTGQYSRRIWFLYEWLTNEPLDIPDLKEGNYVPLLDEKLQFALEKSVNVPRQRIRNNLPGTNQFCPLIFKSDKLKAFIEEALEQHTYEDLGKISKDVLTRTSAFLLLKDSKASFSIEGENPLSTRAEHWGTVIGEAGTKKLNLEELVRLQKIVIGDSRSIHMGLRKEGGFVGEHENSFGPPKPEHVSARWEDLGDLMNGLLEAASLMETRGFPPVLAAASIGFGFVFIHPFVDGNGRLHRYIIQHILAETGFSPAKIVFPISAAIQEKMDDYRRVLIHYSHSLLPFIEWVPTKDRNVEVKNDTADYYRYFDATKQAEFLFDCIAHTISRTIPDEIKYLKRYDAFKSWLDDNLPMPNKLVSLLVVFLSQNEGRLSLRAKKKEFADLEHEEIQSIEAKYKEIFQMEEPVRYSIAIRPSQEIIDDGKGMKADLKKAVGGFFNSVNSEVHISLFEFFAYEGDYPLLLKMFRGLVEGLHPFEIEFNGFNHFSTNGAFYVEPTNGSSSAIIERCNQFKRDANSKILKDYTEGWTELFGKPHMSIGRRLPPEWIEIAYSLFKEYHAQFLCESIVVRKFNGDRRQFDVIDTLPMLGKGSSSPVQLGLF